MDVLMNNATTVTLIGVALMTALLVVIAVMVLRPHLRASRRGNYGSFTRYLRAAPVSDEEKRDAVDLALKGVILCLLGFLFPPLLLIGLVPLFFGARKVAYGSMGLGLVDDARHPDG